MFGSETLEVGIGLAVLFSFFSLFATTLRETIEACVKQRSKLIHRALEELLAPPGEENSGAVRELYESIAISPLFSGPYKGRKRNLPSYIPSSDFAAALLEIAGQKAGVASGAADWIGKIPEGRLAQVVRSAFEAVGGDPDKARELLAKRFDSQMERVSGWYKRSTHAILIAIGFSSAVLFNVDAVVIAEHLYRNDALREAIVARAQSSAAAQQPTDVTTAQAAQAKTGRAAKPDEVFNELSSYRFPIGWAWAPANSLPTPVPQCALSAKAGEGCALGPSGVVLMILGWVITAMAVSLGAPFWFDLLNKIMVIRSTVKPFDKSPPEGSEDRQARQEPQVVKLEIAAANAPGTNLRDSAPET